MADKVNTEGAKILEVKKTVWQGDLLHHYNGNKLSARFSTAITHLTYTDVAVQQNKAIGDGETGSSS